MKSFSLKLDTSLKERGNVKGNLIVAIRVMQNVISCSIKERRTPIRAKYVVQHTSSQILLIEILFGCNSYRKYFVDFQIQTENPFVFKSQRKNFVDAKTQTKSFHR